MTTIVRRLWGISLLLPDGSDRRMIGVDEADYDALYSRASDSLTVTDRHTGQKYLVRSTSDWAADFRIIAQVRQGEG